MEQELKEAYQQIKQQQKDLTELYFKGFITYKEYLNKTVDSYRAFEALCGEIVYQHFATQ